MKTQYKCRRLGLGGDLGSTESALNAMHEDGYRLAFVKGDVFIFELRPDSPETYRQSELNGEIAELQRVLGSMPLAAQSDETGRQRGFDKQLESLKQIAANTSANTLREIGKAEYAAALQAR